MKFGRAAAIKWMFFIGARAYTNLPFKESSEAIRGNEVVKSGPDPAILKKQCFRFFATGRADGAS